ncbi:MAG: LysR substrate-binding domain-containing protein, partial [Candidatus Binatia bacterium]
GMNIDCLETFLEVARLESFTKAAGVRHLTQPAVSRQVQRLEEELGVKLFVQTGRRVRLSAEGELLVEEGARVISRIHGVRTALEELTGLQRGELRVGASSTPGMYMLPGLLAEFRGEHPGVELRYELSNSRAIESMVLRNDLELGFVGEQLGTDYTASEAFADDRIRLVVSPAHPLARRRSVSLGELLSDHYVAREAGSATRRAFEEWLAQRGKRWQPFLELGSVEAVKQAVAAGLGIGAVSGIAVEWEVEAGRLALLRIEKMELARKLFVLYRKDRRLSPAANAFLTMARRTASRRSRRF